MALVLFTVLNGLGVVFLVYVLVQFWNEEHRPKKPAMRGNVIEFSRENGPTVFVVTHLISGGLQVEPTPVSGELHASLEAFSVKVEPTPAAGKMDLGRGGNARAIRCKSGD